MVFLFEETEKLTLLFFIASFQTVFALSADSSFTTCVAISLLLRAARSAELSFSPNTALATIGDSSLAAFLSIPNSLNRVLLLVSISLSIAVARL